MKFRQHVRVYGYPDELKHTFSIRQPAKLEIKGVGVINLMSKEKAGKLRVMLKEHDIEYVDIPKMMCTRVKYISAGKGSGIEHGIRGKVFKGDILYTIEADDERTLLDRTDAVIKELDKLNIDHEDVCKWLCITPAVKKNRNK